MAIIMDEFPAADEQEVFMLLQENVNRENRTEIVVNKLMRRQKKARSRLLDAHDDDDVGLEAPSSAPPPLPPKRKSKPVCTVSKPPADLLADDEATGDDKNTDNTAQSTTAAAAAAAAAVVSQSEEQMLNNDPIYRDMQVVARMFPGRDKNEIYAYLEAHYDRPNRIDIVTDELLRLQEQSQEDKQDGGGQGRQSPDDVTALLTTSDADPPGGVSSSASATATKPALPSNEESQLQYQQQQDSTAADSTQTAAAVDADADADDVDAGATTAADDDQLTPTKQPAAADDVTVTSADYDVTAAAHSSNNDARPLSEQLQLPINDDELRPLVQLEQDVETVRAVFPDCDPMWLYETLAGKHNDEDRVASLTSHMSEQRSYPLLKDRLEKERRLKAKQRVMNMTLDMNEFLEMFPDPEAHFMNTESAVSDAYRAHCRTFLRNRFDLASNGYIDACLDTHSGHLLPAFCELEAAMAERTRRQRGGGRKRSRFRQTPRAHEAMPEEPDERFYRELLYVEHRQEVKG